MGKKHVKLSKIHPKTKSMGKKPSVLSKRRGKTSKKLLTRVKMCFWLNCNEFSRNTWWLQENNVNLQPR